MRLFFRVWGRTFYLIVVGGGLAVAIWYALKYMDLLNSLTQP